MEEESMAIYWQLAVSARERQRVVRGVWIFS